MALYAASNIAQAVNNFGSRGYAKYAGVILNSRNVENEVEIVEKALEEIGGEIVQVVPRNPLVQQAENQGKTVVRHFRTAIWQSVILNLRQKWRRPVLEVKSDELWLSFWKYIALCIASTWWLGIGTNCGFST